MTRPDVRRVACDASGHEPLTLLECNAIDLVITDFQMSGIDGLQLIGHIKSRGYAARLVLMTAFESAELTAAAIRSGADFIIPKATIVDDLPTFLAHRFARPRATPRMEAGATAS